MRMLLGLRAKELEEAATGMGLKPYRGRQLANWIYRKGVASFEAMTDLPKRLREKLSQQFEITPFRVQEARRDSDGTTKYLLELRDAELIEAVWLPYREWETICVSTQVGCPIGCAFCASGRNFVRNLTAGEIVGQVILLKKEASPKVVFMGIGEPLLNRKQLFRALEILNCEVGIGSRNLTISTVGISAGIKELADLGMEVNLAISLHAPEDGLRRQLIRAALPPIRDLLQAAEHFFQRTGRRISFEYVLLSGVNDLPEHAESLARLLQTFDFKLHLNLIPYNEVMSEFKRPSPERVREFKQRLEEQGINATIRKERGRGIQAACGQLRWRGSACSPSQKVEASPE